MMPMSMDGALLGSGGDKYSVNRVFGAEGKISDRHVIQNKPELLGTLTQGITTRGDNNQ